MKTLARIPRIPRGSPVRAIPALTLVGLLAFALSTATGAIVLRVTALDGKGDAMLQGFNDGNYFFLDSCTFGVDRELLPEGEHPGTPDINIGVGSLTNVVVTKSLDSSSTTLYQFAMNGNSFGTAFIYFVDVGGGVDAYPVAYLAIKLDRCFVKSWTAAGNNTGPPKEQVAFYFNSIAVQHLFYPQGVPGRVSTASWDRTKAIKWTEAGELIDSSGIVQQ